MKIRILLKSLAATVPTYGTDGAACLVGLLRDSLSVLETVDQDTYQEDGFSLFFLRVAIGIAIDPQNREGGLL